MDWKEAVQQAVQLRHWFHQYPELTWEEEQTAEKIRSCLDDWGIEWRSCATLGTVAILGINRPGDHIALRADMDALPIAEQGGLNAPATAANSGRTALWSLLIFSRSGSALRSVSKPLPHV
ncbi:amidohydrolase [Thiomicrorhabdus xiamenensis]|uniref:Amidohydrolase n=1 Tax=Thiomicrorhabdus xiamenensis TaxID=2739063 RepID=A0A7D4NQT0_9GAMM|nr:amidohydrolase [Thiomicrorhabdus xiamenensis]QKI89491.1 amidohydrolase [Thiomicrorhabdus xiamenensis]